MRAPRIGHVLEALADVLARVAERDVDHLVAVALEQRDLLRPRVVREADDLLRRHAARVHRDVDARVLESLRRDGFMGDPDREPDAVHLGQRGRVEVLRVVPHREDRRVRVADPLAVEELGVDPGGLVHARLRERLGDRRACSREDSTSRTLMPCSSRTRAIAEPTCPAPNTTTSRTVASSGASSRLQTCAASGEPMTTMRSPGWDDVVPPGKQHRVAADDGRDLRVPRKRRVAQLRPPRRRRDAPSSTSNSTIWTWPSAKTSVCRAAGTPMMRLIAWAVSSSELTTKSTSSWPSRHRSTYSTFEVRMTVVAFLASLRANIPATRFTSSREVHAITRSDFPDAGGREVAPARSVPLEGREVEARGERREP